MSEISNMSLVGYGCSSGRTKGILLENGSALEGIIRASYPIELKEITEQMSGQ